MQTADLEHRYYQYLRSKAYSTQEALEEMQRYYLPYFQGFTRVLDIGCGHGEFLRLLTAAGHEAVGVDIDPAMVQACRDQGFTAYQADATAWLSTQPEPFDAIFSSNVIEHLDVEAVTQVVRAAYSALRPGGLLAMATPNAESVIVQLYEFWRDPTHVRLYNRQLIEFFYHDAGFIKIQSAENPIARWNGLDKLLTPPEAPVLALPKLEGAVNRLQQTDSTLESPELALPKVETSLLETPLPEGPPAIPYPMPAPPGPGASLRQRIAYRMADFVFRKFLQPYLMPLRHEIKEQWTMLAHLEKNVAVVQQRAQQADQSVAHRLEQWFEQRIEQSFGKVLPELQENILLVQQMIDPRFHQLAHSHRFLYPSREIVVVGYKPDATDAG